MMRTYLMWKKLHKRPTFGLFGPNEETTAALLQLARFWKVDAMALMLNRGCPPMNVGMYSFVKPYLVERGMPTIIFEANYADCREADPARTIDTLVAFLEGLGLRRLPKA
jgi:benzoyl-CoA reductase/2-hydroxyglutaryl-CoA dehydratase subunit BcrC/BadD/HgdB